MPKARSQWVCGGCGRTEPKPYGRCPGCGAWNTMTEERVEVAAPTARPSRGLASAISAGSVLSFTPLTDVAADRSARTSTGIGELDRVLGGGIVDGSVVLVGGEPGVGKSTILGMLARNLSEQGRTVAYVSGEESLGQIKLRADRLGNASPTLVALAETDLESIMASVEAIKPSLLILDSIQTVTTSALQGAAGSVGQVRECAQALTHFAKQHRIPTFIVSHVNKSGEIAGPHALEHIVDTVLYLEGDRFHIYRMLRAVKNRFGSVDEVGVFRMEGSGLLEVPNPSEIFLSEESVGAAGSVIAATLEGSRPLLVEIQALTAEPTASFPRRTVNGVDLNRVNVICATLAKRVGLDVYRQDTYVNVTGGLRTDDPACDLAVACAIASAYTGRALPKGTVVIGEIGLAGEIRKVAQLERRATEAARLGFTTVIAPNGQLRLPREVSAHQFGTIADCMRFLKLPDEAGPTEKRKPKAA